MREARRALVLVNRRSRQGGQGVDAALDVLRQGGLALDLESPGEPEHTGRLILARRDEVDLVIVAGGDGTLNAATPALLETGLTLGILPTGTGNDLARTLKLPLDLAGAAGVIVAGRSQAIDVGMVNGQPFLNAATVGLSNEAARRLTGEVKQRWGPLGYPVTLVDAWRASHPFDAAIEGEFGRERRRSIQIVIGNGRHHGAGMTVAASAAIDDHALDVYSLDPQPWWRAVRLIPLLRLGADHAPEGMWRTRTRRLRLETDRPLRIRTDGEPTTRTPAIFEVKAAALRVLVP
ncbi:MAG: lipid kinase [Geminicoccaceae bacterium]